MANISLRVWENVSGLGAPFVLSAVGSNDATMLWRLHVLPGSIAFNSVGMAFALSGAASVGATIGLYTLNGSTLTLVNSASGSTINLAGGSTGFLALATSAASTIGSGTICIGYLTNKTVTATNGVRPLLIDAANQIAQGALTGGFWIGGSNATTSALPTSVNTTDLTPNLAAIGAGSMSQPYMVISA